MRHSPVSLFSACLLVAASVAYCLGADKVPSVADFFVGRPAPDFHLKDLDGRDVQLSALRGNVVVLEFWASWCGPCRAEIPAIERISKQFAKKNVVVIGINSEEPEATVRSFVAKNKMTYRVALTPEHSIVIRQYAAMALPTVAIVDPNGIVAAYRVGERSDTEYLLADDIHHVLSAKYRPPEPKPIPVMQAQATPPAAPAVSAAGGPDPNWTPQTGDEFLARGFLQLNRNQYAAVQADAEKALKLCPDSYVGFFLHGRAAYEQKDYSTAIKDFNKVVEGRPNWPQGYHYRGLSYSYSGDHQRAIPDYEKMLQLNPYLSNGYNDLGWALRELKQFDQAKTNLDKAIELEPDYIRARENRATLFAKLGDWKNEIDELATILNLSPNDVWAKNAREAAQKGREFSSDGQPDSALPDVHPRLVSKVEPEYTEEARRAAASAMILCSAEISAQGIPQNIQVTHGAGFGLDENAVRAVSSWRFEPASRQGVPVADTAQIEVNFRNFAPQHENQFVSLEFKLPNGASRPQLIKGKVPENLKNGAEAEMKLTLTVDGNGTPQNVSVLKTTSNEWAERAVAQIKDWRFRPAAMNGQPIDSQGTFELRTGSVARVGAANKPGPDAIWQPQTAEQYLARGYARLRIQEYPQAEVDAEAALKLRNDSVSGWFLLGRAAYEANEYSTAADAFDKVIAQRADWAQAYRYRGLAYAHSGQPQRAIADYQKAIELDPDFGAAYNSLGAAYLQQGDMESAKGNLDKALELEPNLISARENRAKLLGKQGDFAAEQKELTIILGLAPNNQWAKNTMEAVRQKMQ